MEQNMAEARKVTDQKRADDEKTQEAAERRE